MSWEERDRIIKIRHQLESKYLAIKSLYSFLDYIIIVQIQHTFEKQPWFNNSIISHYNPHTHSSHNLSRGLMFTLLSPETLDPEPDEKELTAVQKKLQSNLKNMDPILKNEEMLLKQAKDVSERVFMFET